MKGTVIFLHIPKTAGTTLRHIIGRNYPDHKIATFYEPGNQKRAIQKSLEEKEAAILYGHFDYLSAFSTSANYAFTFLRNPVDRVISNYLHVKNSDTDLHKQWMKSVKSFPDFLTLPQGNNWQARFLAGQKDEADYNEETLFKIASENLQKLNFVGITEHFKESLCILSMDLNWVKLGYGKQNVTGRTQDYNKLKHDFESEICAANVIDIELYEQGLSLFNQRLSKLTKLNRMTCGLRGLR